MTAGTVSVPRAHEAAGAESRRSGFGLLLRSEWTKFRTVRGWVIGMFIAALLTVFVGLFAAGGGSSNCQNSPTGPTLSGKACLPYIPYGPGGEVVTDSFNFAHQPLTGSGSITVRVLSLSGAHPDFGRSGGVPVGGSGPTFPEQRRRKAARAAAAAPRTALAQANRDRADMRLGLVAAEAASSHGYPDIGAFVLARPRAGASLASVSREAGLHEDWMARHLGRVDAAAAELARQHARDRRDAAWLPALRALGYSDVAGYLRDRHLVQHRTVNAIAAEIQRHGRAGDTPAAAVRWGTRPDQETVSGTLATIADRIEAAHIKPPATVIIGEVVALRDKLDWFEQLPLFGRRIVVTRAPDQAAELSERLRALGADPIELPVISLEPPADREYGTLRAALEAVGQVIGPNDMLIAAQTLALGCALVTDNTREFGRVARLRLANWLR